MNNEIFKAALAGLLHDVGKFAEIKCGLQFFIPA
jgi:HD-GYP domain-containing protein (c-di-GMP phosphodiesterase class II)